MVWRFVMSIINRRTADGPSDNSAVSDNVQIMKSDSDVHVPDVHVPLQSAEAHVPVVTRSGRIVRPKVRLDL
jgi:hypothetical protein